MQFFSQYSHSAIPVLGKTVHHCNNFLLGERWVGEDEWFCKEKKSCWCEGKGTLSEESSSVAGNAILLCSSWLYNGQETMDRLTQHPSSAWSQLQCLQLRCCCLPPVLRPRQQAQVTSLHENLPFVEDTWELRLVFIAELSKPMKMKGSWMRMCPKQLHLF